MIDTVSQLSVVYFKFFNFLWTLLYLILILSIVGYPNIALISQAWSIMNRSLLMSKVCTLLNWHGKNNNQILKQNFGELKDQNQFLTKESIKCQLALLGCVVTSRQRQIRYPRVHHLGRIHSHILICYWLVTFCMELAGWLLVNEWVDSAQMLYSRIYDLFLSAGVV